MRGVGALLSAVLSCQSAAALAPREATRRGILFAGVLGGALPAALPAAANAKTDCVTDCLENCERVAPGNGAYCGSNCDDYCAQPDRRDGLSGSVSSDNGYVGLASPIRGGDTVEYGADKPPQLDILPQGLLPPQLRRGATSPD